MKRGMEINEAVDENEPALKKKKISKKSLRPLIKKVNEGNYEDFRKYIIDNEFTELSLGDFDSDDINIIHVGNALQGTPINELNLFAMSLQQDYGLFGLSLVGTNVEKLYVNYQDMGDENAIKLLTALRGTKVRDIDLSENELTDGAGIGEALCGTQIDDINLMWNDFSCESAESLIKKLVNAQVQQLYLGNEVTENCFGPDAGAKLAACIPGTSLIYVGYVCDDSNILDEAVQENLKNIWARQFNPFYMASLKHMPANEKAKFVNLPQPLIALSAEEQRKHELKYSGGIFMALGNLELENLLLTHLPGVRPMLATQYQLASQNVTFIPTPEENNNNICVRKSPTPQGH